MDDRKSISGYVFSLGTGMVSWSSKKQSVVALSSTEAEFVAANEAARQAIWMRKLLSEFGFEQRSATNILCDNVSANFLSKNAALHNRSKHIDIKYHYIKSLVETGQVELVPCNTHDQVADVLTKALGTSQFCLLRERLGIKRL
jgi:hypothetical protein